MKIIAHFLDREMGFSHASIMILDESKKHFTFAHSRGNHRLPVRLLKFEREHPLVAWFDRSQHRGNAKRGAALLRSKINRTLLHPTSQIEHGDHTVFEKIKNVMDILKAELIVPAYDKKDLIALLLVGEKKDGAPFTSRELTFFQTLAHTCSMAIQAAEYHGSLVKKNLELEERLKEIDHLRQNEKQTYHQILRSLAQEVLERDPYTYAHINQVERLGMKTAKELGLDMTERQRDILSASLILHDVGKIGIPDRILNKPARLDSEEWKVMQTHVIKGVRILEPLASFRQVAEIIHCHHERLDGTGYPRGLKSNDIPIESRIISVVDAFHAIVSKRVYDAERPVEEAFRELRQASGTQFDGQVVQAFIHVQTREMARKGIKAHALETPSELEKTQVRLS